MEAQEQILFTPAALLDFLTQVEELQGVDIGINDNDPDNIQVTIGESIYTIHPDRAVEVGVPEEDLAAIGDAQDDAYMQMEESGELISEEDESIEGGLLKELAKTLAIGGMVRLGAKWLRGE